MLKRGGLSEVKEVHHFRLIYYSIFHGLTPGDIVRLHLTSLTILQSSSGSSAQ